MAESSVERERAGRLLVCARTATVGLWRRGHGKFKSPGERPRQRTALAYQLSTMLCDRVINPRVKQGGHGNADIAKEQGVV